jgi:excisionase family DNA binding protein
VSGPLLSVKDAAAYLGIKPQTIYNMRTAGTAPAAVKLGRLVRFRQADLDSWVEEHSESAA